MSRLSGLDWHKSWSSQGPLTKGLSKSVLCLLSVSSGVRAAPVCCDRSLFGFVRQITAQLYAKTYKKCPGFSLLCLGEGRAIIYPLSDFRVAWRPAVGLWGTSGNHLFIGDYSFQPPDHVMKFWGWLKIEFVQGSLIYFHYNNIYRKV